MTNNKQREEYFRNKANWEEMGTIPPIANFITNIPIIEVSKLTGYPIIKVEALLAVRDVAFMTVLGYYKSDGLVLNEIYSKTVNQCIDIMRAIDNEIKNALK